MNEKKLSSIFEIAALICDSISKSAMQRVNDIWEQIFIKTSECIDNQLFQKRNIINSFLIHRFFNYYPHRLVKCLQIWACLLYTSDAADE